MSSYNLPEQLHSVLLSIGNKWYVRMVQHGGNHSQKISSGGIRSVGLKSRRGCCGWRVGRYGGPIQIACLGIEPNGCSTQLVATVVKERSPQPTVHLTIIQACFTLSSRVLLVSNLRISNWKCTVKRFFNRQGIGYATNISYLIVSKARHGCKAMIQVHVIPTRYMVQAPLSGAHLQLFGGEFFLTC